MSHKNNLCSELDFIRAVEYISTHENPSGIVMNLYTETYAQNAVRRYVDCWLPLVKKHGRFILELILYLSNV